MSQKKRHAQLTCNGFSVMFPWNVKQGDRSATEFVCVDPQEVARSSGHWYLQPLLDPRGE